MTVKEILRDLVAINTIKDKENKEMMDYIENFVKPLGFDVDRRKNPETGKEVLVATFGDNPTIGFLGHTDTVDVTEGWTYDPFNLTEEDGKLYGLGACDMKGGIAFGIDTCWFNPKGKEKPTDMNITYTVKNLSELEDIIL